MIQVINRALDIMELIAQNRAKTYSLSEIAVPLKLNTGTCANIIKTLVNRGYLEQESRKSGYRLGTMAYMLTGNYSHKHELMQIVPPIMEKLSKTLGEGCILSILKENIRVILHEVKSTHELQVVNKKEKDCYLTSTGRIILASYSEKEQKEFIRKYGLPSREIWPEVDDKDDLMTELRKIWKKQIAIQVSESQVIGLAIPIKKNEKVIASLGVYLPMTRYVGNQDKILNELLLAGEQINKEIQNYNSKFFKSV